MTTLCKKLESERKVRKTIKKSDNKQVVKQNKESSHKASLEMPYM